MRNLLILSQISHYRWMRYFICLVNTPIIFYMSSDMHVAQVGTLQQQMANFCDRLLTHILRRRTYMERISMVLQLIVVRRPWQAVLGSIKE